MKDRYDYRKRFLDGTFFGVENLTLKNQAVKRYFEISKLSLAFTN